MRRIINIISLSAILILSSCSEESLLTYGDVNYIYFEETADEDAKYPEQSYTFIFEDASVTTRKIELPVLITGKFTGKDRTFSVEAIDSLSTAIEGTHYSILENSRTIADEATGGTLIIELLRATDLKDKMVTLAVELTSDDAFKTGENNVYVINFSDFFTKPDWWIKDYGEAANFPNIGPFSQRKAGFWLEFYGIDDGSDPWCCPPYWDGESYNSFYGYPQVELPLCSGDVLAFRTWLANKEQQSGTDLLDENGKRIIETLDY